MSLIRKRLSSGLTAAGEAAQQTPVEGFNNIENPGRIGISTHAFHKMRKPNHARRANTGCCSLKNPEQRKTGIRKIQFSSRLRHKPGSWQNDTLINSEEGKK